MIGNPVGKCIKASQTLKPRWKAIELQTYGSRSYGPGTLPARLALKVHRRIRDRDLERAVILDIRKWKTPNPDTRVGDNLVKVRKAEGWK